MNPTELERGRKYGTLLASLLLALIAVLGYFLVAGFSRSSVDSFVKDFLPGVALVLLVFAGALFSQSLGLWRRTDRLDSLFGFVEEQKTALANQISVHGSFHEIRWNEVFSEPGPIRFVSNFAPLQLRQGKAALQETLAQQGRGHIFVFLDPHDNQDSLELLAGARRNLLFAATVREIVSATRESLALLLDLLPNAGHRLDERPRGVRIILAAHPVTFVAYYSGHSVVFSGSEVFPNTVRETPRLLMSGAAAERVREYADRLIDDMIRFESIREPTLEECIAVAAVERGYEWQRRTTLRLGKR